MLKPKLDGICIDKSNDDTLHVVEWSSVLEGFRIEKNYIHGYVTSETSVQNTLELYRRVSATTFCVRQSSSLQFDPRKVEKDKIQFSTRSFLFSKSSRPKVSDDGVPFCLGGRKILECRFGPRREHKKKGDGTLSHKGSEHLNEQIAEHDYTTFTGHSDKHRQRRNLLESRKKGCEATISVWQICRFPDHAMSSNKYVKVMQSKTKEKLLLDLSGGGEVRVENRFYICLPLQKAHSKHSFGGLVGTAQTVHPQIIQWIKELVGGGVTDATEIQSTLRHYVKTRMSDVAAPSILDRAYYPTIKDIRNHIYRARVITMLDQEALDTASPNTSVASLRKAALEEVEVLRGMVHNFTTVPGLLALTEGMRALQDSCRHFLVESPEGLKLLTSVPSHSETTK